MRLIKAHKILTGEIVNAYPDEGFILKRGGPLLSYEIWLPAYMQRHLPYEPNKLPAVRREVVRKRSTIHLINMLRPTRIEKTWVME